MKKKLLLILVMFFITLLGSSAYSQLSKTLLNKDKLWCGVVTRDYNNPRSEYIENYISDSISINDTMYYKMENNYFGGVFREDSNRIFIRNSIIPSNQYEKVFIDFNAKLGDIFPVYDYTEKLYIERIVTNVDSVEINEQWLKRITLKFGINSQYPTSIWIEGIGDILNGFNSIMYELYNFTCLYQDNELVYTYNTSYSNCGRNLEIEDIYNDKSIKIYPTVISDYINIEGYTYPLNIDIIDLFGRKVLSRNTNDRIIDCSMLKSGVYFILIKNKLGHIVSKNKIIKK